MLTIGQTEITLKDVLHVPAIGSNLLSVAQVVDCGHQLFFSTSGCQIRNDNGLRLSGIREGNVYLLKAESQALIALLNKDAATSAEVWHRQIGHRDFSATARGRIQQAVTGLEVKRGDPMAIPGIVEEVCKTCAAGHQHKEAMTGKREKTTNLLKQVHSDVCGSIETPALTGERYFVTFIDEASGRLAVSLLHGKGDVFENFVAYRQRAEKETGKEIKLLRTDGEGEYMNARFNTYLREAGIVKVTTPPYTPAQNGLAERANRTLIEAARCKLLDAGLGNESWGYAVLATAHIVNRMPSRVHANNTPFEIWTGNKPSIGHLRIFGCPTHVFIPAENRRKLDPKSAQCTFIGYTENQGTRVYKLYQPDSGKTIISRDMVFDEADNQQHHIPEPAAHQEGDPAASKTPFTHEEHRNGTHLVSLVNEEGTSHQGEEGEDTYLPDADIPAETEDTENDIEMLDTIVLQPPGQGPQSTTRVSTRQTSSLRPMHPSGGSAAGRPQRIRKPVDLFKPAIWRAKAMLARTQEEPRTLMDALASEDATEWRAAWDSEVKSLQDNGTWVLEELPEGRKAIGCRWVFKIKEDGRYKARLVAKGYAQEAGIDFDETYAPVAKFTTLRMLLALSAENDWEIEGMDVKTAFLHSELVESIYMEIPEGLDTGPGNSPKLVCRLVKTIYGLKQAPRAWYGKINAFFSEHGFYRSEEDHSLFVHENRRLIILLYVDDLVLAASSHQAITWGKEALSKKFNMTELGKLKTFIGVEVFQDRTRRTLKVSQSTYLNRILKNHGMEDCTAVATPIESGTRLEKSELEFIADPADKRRYQSAVGSLMYAMLGTRPDIAYAVGMVSKYCNNPNNDHWIAVKRIFRYLAGTRDLGILYGHNTICQGYCDSD